MMNYRHPLLGQPEGELFDFLKPKAKGTSVYDVFLPNAPVAAPAAKPDFYDFFKPASKKREEALVPAGGGGDPFAAAAARPVGPASRTIRNRTGIEAWKPYPRMREGYQTMSGPGDHDGTGFLKNPAFWLIAGVGVLIALEVNGVTKLSSNA